MKFSQVIGHSEIKKKLIESVKIGRIPHAQMFLGQPGGSNLALALAYGTYLICQNRSESDSCGECGSCKKMESLQYADLHFSFPYINVQTNTTSDLFLKEWRERISISPYFEADDWRDDIVAENKQLFFSVHEAHSLIHKLSLTSYEGSHKLLIIWLPEYMKSDTSNKLLKMIEEPPDKTVIIMVSNSVENMLATILSRTQVIRLDIISNEQVEQGLIERGIEAHRSAEIAKFVDGNYSLAIKMAEDGYDASHYLEVFSTWMRACYKPDFQAIVSWVDAIQKEGREQQKQFLSYALHFTRQCIVGNYEQDELVRLTEKERAFAVKFGPFIHHENVLDLNKLFTDAHYDITRNIYGKIVMLDLSLKVHKLIRMQVETQ